MTLSESGALPPSRVALARLHPSPEALRLISFETAARLCVLPLTIAADGHLRVMAEEPRRLPCADELQTLTRRRVELIPSTVPDLEAEIRRAYQFSGRIARLSADYLHDERNDEAAPERLDDASPVSQIVESMIAQAIGERASDIHIEPGEKESRVRFRIDGRLVDAVRFPAAIHRAVTARVKIMAGMDIAESRLPQDGRILRDVDGRKVDFRISTLPSVRGEKTVLRLLDRERALRGLEGLGCEGAELARIKNLLKIPNGIILNTGPTGSGKTTTLYAMLERLNLAEFNAVTVEDPVEYDIPGVTQVQVNERSGLSFAAALRSILRQDPDIVMLGEIRDGETALLAVRAALTGHVVLSTLHTNDAASAALRLIDMGAPAFLVASALRGVIAQRLVRKLCPHCRQPYALPERECERLELPRGSVFYRPVGCPRCDGRGYAGRTAIFEVLAVDEEISALIAREESVSALRKAAVRKGMRTLERGGIAKALAGVTSYEEGFGAIDVR